MNDDSGHWVLLGPKRKQAGLRDQKLIAIKIEAKRIAAESGSQGIIQFLLPKTGSESERLKKLTDRGYTIKKVIPRRNLNKEVREAVMSDALMLQLAVFFAREKGKSFRAMQAVNRGFARWICNKLKDLEPNHIKDIVGKAHQELLNRTSEDWWKKQINQRVKKLKK
jgi:hypothetical protein